MKPKDCTIVEKDLETNSKAADLKVRLAFD